VAQENGNEIGNLKWHGQPDDVAQENGNDFGFGFLNGFGFGSLGLDWFDVLKICSKILKDNSQLPVFYKSYFEERFSYLSPDLP
jgi:hypothetical protein